MNGREIALRALYFEEPDRIPISELGVDPVHQEKIAGMRVIEAFGGRERALQHNIDLYLTCYRKLRFDLIPAAITAPKGWKPKVFPDGTFTDEWGRIYKVDSFARTSIWIDSIIKSIEEWQSHTLPDPHAPGRLDTLEYLVKRVEEGEMLIVGMTRSPFAMAWEIFTPSFFCQLLFEKPRDMARVIEQITNFNVEITKLLIEAGVELIVNGGDLAEKNGPMISPKYFEKIIYPNMRKEVDATHKRGIKFIKHTDGYVTPLLDGLIEKACVDGVHSLDPSANVSIRDVKQKYGNKLILMGNVSVDNLAIKTKEEIARETKECVKAAAPGGGFVLSSSNSWYADCKIENCLSMVETGRKYGRYPACAQNSF